MTREKYIKYGVILVVAVFALSLPSCEVLKTKRRAASDSTAVHTIDSSRVIRTDAGSKSDSTWWREIINFMPRDSTYIEKTNTLKPVYYTQPIPVYRP